MATDSSNANEGVSAGGDSAIHLILQGGVGLISRGRQVRCIDGDPVNRSLSQYKALGAESLDLVNEDGLIQRWRYDALVERFLTSADVFVVDSGATAFLPFWTYIVESEMIRVLSEARRKVYLHVPVTRGETLNDTLLGFSAVVSATTDRSVIVWLNEYFGPITHGGKGFEEMQAYSDNRDKILTSVALPQRSPDTYRRTIRAMGEKADLRRSHQLPGIHAGAAFTPASRSP